MAAPTRQAVLHQCLAEHPMPAGTSPRDLARWEHPEMRRKLDGDTLTRTAYQCMHCGLLFLVPVAKG